MFYHQRKGITESKNMVVQKRYKDTRKYLTKIDWNNKLENKTETECWNILKIEIDCIVDTFVPLKKHEKRFKGRDSNYLGQLIVTQTIVAKKLRDMKDRSPGVDGIPPKVLLEIVEQISIPLVFNLSLEEGVVPLE